MSISEPGKAWRNLNDHQNWLNSPIEDCGSDGKTCISGEKGCEIPTGPQCDLPGQCLEIPIDSAIVSSKDECLVSLCQPDPDCEWFSFDNSTGICLTFSQCESLNECYTCVTGEDECPASGPKCWWVLQTFHNFDQFPESLPSILLTGSLAIAKVYL